MIVRMESIAFLECMRIWSLYAIKRNWGAALCGCPVTLLDIAGGRLCRD